MTTTTKAGSVPPDALDVLPHTEELLALRDRLEQTERAFQEATSRPGELLAERAELERQVLDGKTKAGRQLVELNVRVDHAPGEAAVAADEFAGAVIAWSRYVIDAAEDVRLQADADERQLNRANRLDKVRLYRGAREIPGARQEIQRALVASRPLYDRQLDAAKLKQHARSRVRRLLDCDIDRFLEVEQARRQFVGQARAEAVGAVER